MSGSSLGSIFQVQTWGESHGKALGAVIDGCPAGVPLSEDCIQLYMDRRKPGTSEFTTKRKESDQVHILSGVFEGKTTGTPISIAVFNEDQISKSYDNIKDCYRPGHADFGYTEKYGFRDYRGGGRSSGRETLARVAGGAVAAEVLKHLGIEFQTYTKSIGVINCTSFDFEESKKNPLYMPDSKAFEEASQYLKQLAEDHDSAGGVVECKIFGVKPGIGEPVFDKLDALISGALFSIGGVKGVEFGDGFNAAKLTGSKNNDVFYSEKGVISKKTNHSGGVLGGLSDGDPIVFRAAFKPTPSISQEQSTVNTAKENIRLTIHGRHDPIIVPRAVVVVEAMAAIVLLDLLLLNITRRIDIISKIYKNE